ncbi:phosphatidylinositol-3,5-bisphosphate 5-phosphatase [Metarhizium acridum]|nr:phosphatidylinositol-3,5-bisphosphate 5-phosphatase [Metarhizium acridum]
MSFQRWLQPVQEKAAEQGSMPGSNDDGRPKREKMKPSALEKSKAAQWTFTKAVHDSLNPSVREQEAEDYDRYIRHPQNLPLVVSNDTPAGVDSSEYKNISTAVGVNKASWSLE